MSSDNRSTLMRVLAGAGLVLLLALFVESTHGDIVHLKNGSKLEGKVIERKNGKLKLKTRFGIQVIKESDVKSVEEKETVLETYERKVSELADGDVAARLELAAWCKKNRLRKQWKLHIEEVLKLDPKNETANLAVGKVLHEGEWVTPEEKTKREQLAEEAEFRARGLVKYKGRWVTKEAKTKLEQGYVFRDGKWVTEEELRAAEGFVRHRGRWIKKDQLLAVKRRDELNKKIGTKLESLATPRFFLFTELGKDHARKVGDALEKAADVFYELFPMRKELWEGPLEVVLLKSKENYAKYVEAFGKENGENQSWIRLNKKSHGFYHWMPPTSVDLQEGRHEDSLVSSSVHKLGHVLINLFHFKFNYVPAWMDEGFAVYFERTALGTPQTFCLGEPTRAGERAYGGKKSDIREKWMTAESWKDFVRRDVSEGEDRALKDIIPLRLNDLSSQDLAKSSFLIQYLIDDDARDFARFYEGLREILPRFDVHVNAADKRKFHEQALKGTYRMTIEDLDRKWRDYVRTRL